MTRVTTTFVLVPGAGGDTWYWHRLVAQLESRGHRAVAVELPAADDSAGLDAYADTVAAAVDGDSPVVLVAQSMGGLTAPLVCARVPVRLLERSRYARSVPDGSGVTEQVQADVHACVAALRAGAGRRRRSRRAARRGTGASC